MANVINDIDELIGKYLAQEASTQERVMIETWLKESEENRHYFQHLKTIFDRAATVKTMPHFDTDAAWNNLRSKLHRSQGTKTRSLRPETFPIVWRIAATFLLVSAIGYFAYIVLRQPAAFQPMEVVAKTKTQADTLPDGSSVFLNKQTQLAYSFDVKKKTHQVKIKGEAYFAIRHEKKKTFIVDAEGIFIKDIGTAFNVKAYADSSTIEVLVEEGEVILYSEDNAGVSVHADEKGVYNKQDKTFSVVKPEPNITAYKSKQFAFSGSNLGNVVEQINGIYDQKIIVNDQLKNCRLTVSFNNEEIEEIANVIAETLGLTVVKSAEGNFVLEGTGCEN